jgi:hypothetical protein
MDALKKLLQIALIFSLVCLFIMLMSLSLWLIYDKESFWGFVILLAILAGVITLYISDLC